MAAANRDDATAAEKGEASAGPVFDPAFRASLAELLAWRRDVRRFRPDPLPHGAIERLIGVACRAPSVGLSQPWRFVLVDDPRRRALIRDEFRRCNAAALAAQPAERQARYARLKLAALDEAPCQLAIFADPSPSQGGGLGRRTMPHTLEYSAVAAAHTLWLAARAEGIGVGWVSILEPAVVAAVLEVPPGWVLIGYFCLGHPEQAGDTPELERAGWEIRRSPEDFVLRR